MPDAGIAPAMVDRASGWANVLVQHRPPYLAARRVFLAEILRLASPNCVTTAASLLGIHRTTAKHMVRQGMASLSKLNGPQKEAVLQLAAAVRVDVNTYKACVQRFEQLTSQAALGIAGERRGSRNHAALILGIHRNQLARMLRAERVPA